MEALSPRSPQESSHSIWALALWHSLLLSHLRPSEPLCPLSQAQGSTLTHAHTHRASQSQRRHSIPGAGIQADAGKSLTNLPYSENSSVVRVISLGILFKMKIPSPTHRVNLVGLRSYLGACLLTLLSPVYHAPHLIPCE